MLKETHAIFPQNSNKTVLSDLKKLSGMSLNAKANVVQFLNEISEISRILFFFYFVDKSHHKSGSCLSDY